MGSRLNPDGAKIKALRVQRGWTQEQLADIAGVSCRTVQRAEAAGCAAFETIRSLASALDLDFDQLLTVGTANSQVQLELPPESAIVQGETDPSSPPVISYRYSWARLQVAAVALIAGLITGGILVHRFHTFSSPDFPAPQPGPGFVAGDAGHGPRPAEACSAQAGAVPPSHANGVAKSVVAKLKPESVPERPGNGDAADAAEERFELVDAAQESAHPMLLPSDTPFSSLPPPRGIPAIFVPEVSGTETFPPMGSVGVNVQSAGVIPDAIGQAARKTGGFLAKARTSMKQVF